VRAGESARRAAEATIRPHGNTADADFSAPAATRAPRALAFERPRR
jgi:hypothetical protein